ncbi:MAG TPA: hypothetical protein VK608_13205 [Edaphobacter sp.]|nr:hypothetical protein [Edaphobacter sp.]
MTLAPKGSRKAGWHGDADGKFAATQRGAGWKNATFSMSGPNNVPM